MDYLQYVVERKFIGNQIKWSFKPYYKWITFNTSKSSFSKSFSAFSVLNLIINGLPSILDMYKY